MGTELMFAITLTLTRPPTAHRTWSFEGKCRLGKAKEVVNNPHPPPVLQTWLLGGFLPWGVFEVLPCLGQTRGRRETSGACRTPWAPDGRPLGR